MTLKEEYKASLKSMDTEENIDLFFYRPLGFLWAKLFARLGVTPNWVTIASIILGVSGGILLYFGEARLRWLNYVGIFLIVWANTYDSADGQLARLTKQYSRLGRILDGVSGDLWFIAIYIALVFRELHFGDKMTGDYFASHQWLIWTMAIIAGLCHAKQAAIADYYRQFHLYFLKGKDGSELDRTSQLREEFNMVSWSGSFFKKITMFVYFGYTAQQEAITPRMQALRRKLKELFGDDVAPPTFRDDFRQASLPMMKYTNMLSFNTRTIAMFISVIIQIPWLYFMFEIFVLTVMMLYMIVCHERFCKRFTQELSDGKYQ